MSLLVGPLAQAVLLLELKVFQQFRQQVAQLALLLGQHRYQYPLG
jgi:hypothetical protein